MNPRRSDFRLFYFLLVGFICTLFLDTWLYDYSGFSLLIKILFTSVLMGLLLLIMSCFRWIAYLGIPLFIMTLACVSFAKFAYNYDLDENLIWSIMEVKATDLPRVLGVLHVCFGVAGLLAVFLTTYFLRKQLEIMLKGRKKVLLLSGTILLFFVLLGSVFVTNKLVPRLTVLLAPDSIYRDIFRRGAADGSNLNSGQTGVIKPFTWPLSIYGFAGKIAYDYFKGIKLIDPASLASSEENGHSDSRIIVLFVGESVRYDHMSLNGYQRKTTPLLEKRKDLVSFSDFWSFGTSTSDSFLGIFTDASFSSRIPHYSSFMSIFQKHGFKTFLITDGAATVFLKGKWKNIFGNAIDEFVLTPENKRFDLSNVFKDVLSKDHSRKKMIIINVDGSHFPYKEFYPPEFAIFKPDDFKAVPPFAKSMVEMVNSYDNSILLLDYQINGILEALEKENAVFLYVSDHAQSLGEQGRYMHGGSLDYLEQRKIPGLVWFSRSYQEDWPEKTRNLIRNKDKNLSHDNIFHTMISLGGIKSDAVDDKLDITRESSSETDNHEREGAD